MRSRNLKTSWQSPADLEAIMDNFSSSPKSPPDDELLRQPLEVMAAEYADKIRVGQLVSIEDYVSRNPELEPEIRELFPTIAALEKMKVADNKDHARLATTLPLRLQELGDFEIIREIGRGGMGIVFEAVQRSLGRRVALKVLPKAALLDPKQLQRFSREAHIAAKLHHSHLVSLHGVGEHDGYHFLVMELIDGASIDKILPIVRRKLRSENELTSRSGGSPVGTPPAAMRNKIDLASEQIAEKLVGPLDQPATRANRKNYFNHVAAIGRDAAYAIQYAFQQDVFHRDIKPANLILDDDTHVWISDFGLARSLASDGEAGAEDDRVTKSIDGTFAYMSPESFEGQLTQQSDVYSLGITLYEMLSLQPVFAAENVSEAFKRLSDDSHSLMPLRSSDNSIPRDLETIVAKATSKLPQDRYQTAGLMAADLQRFLDDRPVKASRTSVLQHAGRWCSRNQLSTGLLAAAALMLGLLVSVLATSFYRVQLSNNQVTASLKRETILREKSQRSLEVATQVLDRIYHELVPEDLTVSSFAAADSATQQNEVSASRSNAVSVETAAVLDNLLNFYQRLAEDVDNQGPLAASAIRSIGRVGDIYLHLGKIDEAADRYRKSLIEFETHGDSLNLPIEEAVETARTLNQLGIIFRIQGFDAESHFSHTAALDELSDPIDPADFSTRFQIARTRYLLGQRAKENAAEVAIGQIVDPEFAPPSNDPRGPRRREPENVEAERKHHLNIAIEILNELDQPRQENPNREFLYASCLRELEDFNEATQVFLKLVESHPENPHFRFELIETLRAPRLPREGTGDVELAEKNEIANQKLALEQANWLVQNFPNVPRYGLSRMHVLHRFGHIYNNRFKSGDFTNENEQLEIAIDYLKEAEDQISKLLEVWPNLADHLLWSVVVKASLADALILNGQTDPASKVVDRAAEVFNELLMQKKAGENYLDQDVDQIYQVLESLAKRSGNIVALERLSQSSELSN